MCIYVCAYVQLHVHICMCLGVCIYACMWVYVQVWVWLSIYVCMSICMHMSAFIIKLIINGCSTTGKNRIYSTHFHYMNIVWIFPYPWMFFAVKYFMKYSMLLFYAVGNLGIRLYILLCAYLEVAITVFHKRHQEDVDWHQSCCQ